MNSPPTPVTESRPVTSDNTSSRRNLLKTAAGLTTVTSLAGCADYLSGRQDQDNSQDTQPDTSTNTPEDPEDPETTDNQTEEPNETEDDQEQASSYTWEDILKAEQEFYEQNVDQGLKEVVGLANNQDTVGESFKYTPESEKFEGELKGGIGYSHGSEYFDVEHFADADFEDALRDARTLTYLKLVEEMDTLSTSGAARTQGMAMSKLFENIRGQKLRSSKFTDGHGFLPIVISPNEDPYTVDSTNDFVDKTWENPMSQRSGKSPINQFSEDKLGTLFGLEYQTMIERLSDQPNGEGQTFVGRSLLIDANEHFSTPEIPYDKIVPAVATLNYQDIHDPGKYHMLHAETWDELPEFKPEEEDDFQEYRQQIEDRIVHFDTEEESRPYRMGEKWKE